MFKSNHTIFSLVSRPRALLQTEIARRIHVVFTLPDGRNSRRSGAAKHLGKVNGEGIHGRLAHVAVERLDIGMTLLGSLCSVRSKGCSID